MVFSRMRCAHSRDFLVLPEHALADAAQLRGAGGCSNAERPWWEHGGPSPIVQRFFRSAAREGRDELEGCSEAWGAGGWQMDHLFALMPRRLLGSLLLPARHSSAPRAPPCVAGDIVLADTTLSDADAATGLMEPTGASGRHRVVKLHETRQPMRLGPSGDQAVLSVRVPMLELAPLDEHDAPYPDLHHSERRFRPNAGSRQMLVEAAAARCRMRCS